MLELELGILMGLSLDVLLYSGWLSGASDVQYNALNTRLASSFAVEILRIKCCNKKEIIYYIT